MLISQIIHNNITGMQTFVFSVMFLCQSVMGVVIEPQRADRNGFVIDGTCVRSNEWNGTQQSAATGHSSQRRQRTAAGRGVINVVFSQIISFLSLISCISFWRHRWHFTHLSIDGHRYKMLLHKNKFQHHSQEFIYRTSWEEHHLFFSWINTIKICTLLHVWAHKEQITYTTGLFHTRHFDFSQ